MMKLELEVGAVMAMVSLKYSMDWKMSKTLMIVDSVEASGVS
jgi:hypothetical protein